MIKRNYREYNPVKNNPTKCIIIILITARHTKTSRYNYKCNQVCKRINYKKV